MHGEHGEHAGSALHRLADRIGIVSDYVDQTGRERRVTFDETRVALLRVMGLDASTEERAAHALSQLDLAERARLLEPTRVVPLAALAGERVQLRLPHEAVTGAQWLLSLHMENGESYALDGQADVGAAHVEIALPCRPDLGYHTVHAFVRWPGGERSAVQSLIVVPDACWLPEPESQARVFGFTANLYTVRGDGDQGIGTVTTLAELMQWGAALGAAFVGVNPLHALWNRGTEISPYSPVSRLYRNPLYLDVAAVPELAESTEARELMNEAGMREELARLQASGQVEYERIASLASPVLRALHRTFAEHHRGRDTPRGRAYATYLEHEGDALVDFATFLTLDEVIAAEHGAPHWFRHWPAEYHDPRGAGVATFRDRHAERVDHHCWVQFELDRQLAAAVRAARAAGMQIGLYQDLAVGSSGGGSDAWAYQHLLLHDVSIGAPPDLLGPQGQDWGLPPLDPRRLRESGYRYWIQLLQGAFRHAGALRIDHVLGLFRQFWIPWGHSPQKGAYVRFPSDELLGILALESVRHEAIVVGEDLGTVPPEVPAVLQRWQVLSSRALYFERDSTGAFCPSAAYDRQALATANTHDMAPIAGYGCGRDLELRAAAGLMSGDDLTAALADRARAVQQLRERLAAEGVLDASASVTDAGLCGALHAFLLRTPSLLVGLSLDDLAGETEPVNMPGLTPEQYPSWTRRLHRSLTDLRADPDVRAALGIDNNRNSNGNRG